MPRRGEAWDILAPCESVMAGSAFGGNLIKFNAVIFYEFMKALRRSAVRQGRRVAVITDNANYRKGHGAMSTQAQVAGMNSTRHPQVPSW
jgi:hypothetical protein